MSTASAATAAQLSPTKETSEPITIGPRGILLVLALAGLADWLFWRHWIGISLVVFLLALAAASTVCNFSSLRRSSIAWATVVLIAGLLPYAVNPSPLSFTFGVAAVAYFAVAMSGKSGGAIGEQLGAARRLLLDCGWRAVSDLARTFLSQRPGDPRALADGLAIWIVPVGLGGVFLYLFADANPIIQRWVAGIDLREFVSHLDRPRIASWLIMASLVWPFIFVEIRKRRTSEPAKPAPADAGGASGPFSELLGHAAILRSLIVFNALFAVQTILDSVYLWGAVELPDGMTYATYAHRGAYPLIATALLAAGFVILTMKPGSETERSPLIRGLVFLWIAQNIWLVTSSILRLDLYVAAYSLTYWRVAAFVWMLLVAVGLFLILARIGLGRSNKWLIDTNLVTLGLTLYLCAFANFASFIAHYNVRHSSEMGGGGAALHLEYLYEIGAHAIPALDQFIDHQTLVAANAGTNASATFRPIAWRNSRATEHREANRDWRAWSYWDWQLGRYLDERATRSAPP